MEKTSQQKTSQTEDVQPLAKKNKKFKILIIIAIVILVLLSSFAILFFLTDLFPFNKGANDITEETEKVEEEESYYQIAETTDVSKYTDIVLKDYDNLVVNIFEGFDEEEIDNPDYYIPGIISYSLKSWANSEGTYAEKYDEYGPQMRMYILNLKNVETEDQRDRFYQAVDDIREKNLDANYLESGYLDPLRNFIGGDAYHEVVKEIELESINYKNTENNFAIFSLGGYQDTAQAYPDSEENIGVSFTVFVFATRGNSIIQLESHFPNTATLGVSREDHLSCVIDDGTGTDIYDLECLAEIMQSSEYDMELRAIINNLIERFELEVPTVEISNITEGDCNDHIEGCTADVTVEVSDKEYSFEDLSFFNELVVSGPITNPLDKSDSYYAFNFSTSNCTNSYLFKTDYISKRFSMSGDGMMWNKYFVYGDCGVVGNNIELVAGISMLNTETNKITQLLYGSTATGDDDFLDIAYYIDDISGDELSYKECQYTTSELDSCIYKTLDLKDYL